jgi:hypothetical protein
MTTKTRIPEESRDPVARSLAMDLPVTGLNHKPQLSLVQRMRGRIHIADPEIARRIISDPTLLP